jgi:hypothetical protein
MIEQVVLPTMELPVASRVSVKIEVSADINVTAYVARQKANRFLILQAGDQLVAGEPILAAGPDLRWRVPVRYAPSLRGPLGLVGHLTVDATTGEVTVADGQTTEDLMTRTGGFLCIALAGVDRALEGTTMEKRLIYQDEHLHISIGNDSQNQAQVELFTGYDNTWILTAANAERLCLQILTDVQGSLAIDSVPGVLFAQRCDVDYWRFALLKSRSPHWSVESDVVGYLEYERELYAWHRKSPFVQRFFSKPELRLELRGSVVWKIDPLDAQRMALAILEGIGRQSWLPAFSLVGSKRRPARATTRDALKTLLAVLFMPLLLVGAVHVVIEILNYFSRAEPPITISSTDALLWALLLAFCFVAFAVLKWFQELARLLGSERE